MKLFKSKQQVEELKTLPIPKLKITEVMDLKLSRLAIVFSLSNRKPFTATFDYHERPVDWGNQGTSKQVVLDADSFSELIDKVVDYVEDNSSKKGEV